MKKIFLKKNLKIIILATLILSATLVVFIYNKTINNNNKKFLRAALGECVFNLELASSPVEWYKGLSGRVNLEKNKGMLFVFPDYDIRSFVMRDMSFPLDIIYLRDGQVVNIEKGELLINQGDKLIEYKSNGEVNMVLEINQNLSNVCKINNNSKLMIFD